MQDSPSLSQMFRLRLYLVALAFLILGGPYAVAEENHLEPLIRAWTLRQEKTTSLRVRCALRRVRGDTVIRMRSRSGEWLTIPREPKTLQGSEYVLLDGRKLRHERTLPQWSTSRNSFVEQTSVFSAGKRLHHRGLVPFPQGWIDSFGAPNTEDNASIAGLRWAYRPFDTNLGGIYVPDLRATDRLETVGDRECLVFSCSRLGTSYFDAEVWVDANADYRPVRYINRRDDVRREQIDISYREDRREVPLVRGWTVSTSNGTTEVTVTELSLNGPIDEAEFDLEFPVGTWVSDQRRDEQYIVKANGEKRLIRPDEASYENYQRLLKTKTGDAPIHRVPEPDNDRPKPRLPQA